MFVINRMNPTSLGKINNKTIDGFTFLVYLNTLTAFAAGALIDPNEMRVTGTLRRQGQAPLVLFNETLKTMIIMSHLRSNAYLYLNGVTRILLNAGATDCMLPFRFDLGGPINLIGSDEFELAWVMNTGFFADVSVNALASYIEVDETESNEIEYITPITHSQVIEANQTNPTFNLGSNIMTVILRNDDKTSLLQTARVVNSIKFTSDKVNKDDTWSELLCKAISYYSTITEAGARYQNWIVYDGSEDLDRVSLNCSMNSANLTSSNNYVLWRSYETSDWLRTRADLLQQVKNAKNDNKARINPAFTETELL